MAFFEITLRDLFNIAAKSIQLSSNLSIQVFCYFNETFCGVIFNMH